MLAETKKRMIADTLFVVQLSGAALFCGAQFLRALKDVTGLSIVQFGLVATYLMFHLALGFGAHRAQPSRLTRQAIITYCTWLVLAIALVGAVLYNGNYRWSVHDTVMLFVASVLTIVIVIMGYWSKLGIANPVMKALLAIVYKSIPQILLGWKIWTDGGSGIPALTILVGHFTIIIRLAQIYMMVREAGWDRNRTWLAISETSNELSWVIVTIIWMQ